MVLLSRPCKATIGLAPDLITQCATAANAARRSGVEGLLLYDKVVDPWACVWLRAFAGSAVL